MIDIDISDGDMIGYEDEPYFLNTERERKETENSYLHLRRGEERRGV